MTADFTRLNTERMPPRSTRMRMSPALSSDRLESVRLEELGGEEPATVAVDRPAGRVRGGDREDLYHVALLELGQGSVQETSGLDIGADRPRTPGRRPGLNLRAAGRTRGRAAGVSA